MGDSNWKCYRKSFYLTIPFHNCTFCGSQMIPGEMMYTVTIERKKGAPYGIGLENGVISCKKCYDKFEIETILPPGEE